LIKERFNQDIDSLILTIPFDRDKDVIDLQKRFIERGFLVGAIRRPTVKRPILRVIPNLGVDEVEFKRFIEIFEEFTING
jgi:8-amino-7-oxononanoate synthase